MFKLNRKEKKNSLFIKYEEAPFQYQEAISSLRTNLNFISSNNKYRTIVITSSVPNEGKTSISISLAKSLAASGNSVLLIDCDLRKPSLHRYMGITNGIRYGLTNILKDNEDMIEKGLNSVIKVHHIQNNLYVLTSGTIPLNPSEVLGSPDMGYLIKEFSKRYNYVIMDTSPVSVVTDASVLSQYSDGLIFVVRQNKTTFEQAKQAKKRLEAVNANVLGVVMNDFNIKHVNKYGGNYYYYSYGYGKSSEQ